MTKLRFIFILGVNCIINVILYSQESCIYHQKAMDFYNNNKFDSAAIIFETILPLIEIEYGSQDTSYYIKQLTYTAKSFEKIKQYEKAEYYYLKVKSILDSINCTLEQKYVNSLNNLSDFYLNINEFEKSELLLKQILEIQKIQFGDNNLNYVNYLGQLVYLYWVMGLFEKVEPLLIQISEITKIQLGENHEDYAASLGNLGEFYKVTGQYDKAEYNFRKAAEIVKFKLGQNSLIYAKFITALGGLLMEMGKYDDVEQLLKEANDIRKTLLGENHEDYLYSLDYLGRLYRDLGKYEQAEVLFQKAVMGSEIKFGDNHFQYAHELRLLATLYLYMGKYEESEILMKRALEIDKTQLGENHPKYLLDLNNLASLYQLLGQYEKAELLYMEISKIGKMKTGENHPDYAIFLNNLAKLYQKMGRLEEAELLMRQAFEIDKFNFGENHPNYAIKLYSLANLYKDMGEFEQSETILIQVIEIQKELFGENHPSYAKYLNSLGDLYYQMGDFEKSEMLLKNSLDIVETQLDSNHLDVAKYINSLGLLYQSMGKYDVAEPLFEKVLKIYKVHFGENNLNYAKCLNNLAHLNYLIGNYDQMFFLFKQAFNIYKEQIKMNTGYLSEVELKKFINTFFFNLEIYQSSNYQPLQNQSMVGDFAYDIELYRKGILLKSIVGIKTNLIESEDEAIINMYYEYLSLRRRINKIVISSSNKQFEELKMLENKANEFEKLLALNSKTYKQIQRENEVTWKDILQKLKPGEVAMEFSSFHFYNGNELTDSLLYSVSLLRFNDTLPKMVYLCQDSELRKLIPLNGGTFKDINSLYHNPALYNLIWRPIDSLLVGINTIYYAPSGLLNKISFGAITCPDNSVLMEKYDLVQLSSTRNLSLQREIKPITEAVVYGGIIYDTDTITMLINSKKFQKDDTDQIAYLRSITGNNRSGFRYLPGTLEEAKMISNKLQKKGITTTAYLGTDASEESFKAVSKHISPSVIHISTHGFYFPDSSDKVNNYKALNSSNGEIQFKYLNDPLFRSGLLMTGANLAWRGISIPSNVEDGILTAKEVSNLNLMNTELVILSACKTGQGDVKGSEGVEGLQRGFKMAGARYIMMSLWEIPDKETSEFMVTFYDYWLEGNPIMEAFHSTQLKMKNKYKEESYKWAAFVLVE